MQYSNEVLVLNPRMVLYLDSKEDREIVTCDNLHRYAKASIRKSHRFRDYLFTHSRENSPTISDLLCKVDMFISDLNIEGYDWQGQVHRFIIEHKKTGNRYLARGQDLLFQDKILLYHVDELGKSMNLNYKKPIKYSMYIFGVIRRGEKVVNAPHRIASTILKKPNYNNEVVQKLADVEWVEPSRLEYNNRFFKIQKDYIRSILHNLDDSTARIRGNSLYVCSGDTCNLIFHTRIDGVGEYEDKRYCMSCYRDIELICNLSLDSKHILDVYRTDVDKSNIINKFGTDILEYLVEHGVDIISKEHMPCIHRSCNHCGNSTSLDLEILMTYILESNRRKYLDEHKKYLEDNYVKIDFTEFCNSCAEESLNNRLFTTYRDYRRPKPIIHKKNGINRHLSIESEVITEYDDADEYVDNVCSPKGFDVVHDGSLNGGGVEFKHYRPVIGDKIRETIMGLEYHHDTENNYVDESCGIHVHFNARDFRFKELKALCIIMNHIDDYIIESLPEERRTSTYAKRFLASYNDIIECRNIVELTNWYYKVIGKSSINTDRYNQARYIGTNLHARFYHGTIEFRYHEGSIDSTPILKWIDFLYEIMQSVKEIASRSTKKGRDIEKIIYDRDKIKSLQPIHLIDMIGGRASCEYITNKVNKYNM